MDMETVHSFGVADYSLFGLTLVVSLGIGLFYAFSGGRQRTTAEYLVGNREMKIIPVTISLMVSFESSIMMLGFPAESYVHGIMFWIYIFGSLASNLLAVLIVVPLLHPLKLTSVYEYFELRYGGRSVRLLGTMLGILTYVFYIGIVLYGPGIALEAVTDFPMWASICVVAMASVIYTAIGGLKAVIWTDVFQFVIMFAGIFAIIIKGTMEAGGVGEVMAINKKTGRLNFFDFNPDPRIRHTFWNLIVGAFLRTFGLCFNQSSVQRISATKTMKDAKQMWLLFSPMFAVTLSLTCFEGLVAFAYYYSRKCDPLASGVISNANQVVPYMVMDVFRNFPGMPGLFMASIFSASLSTLSSGLSSLSALTWEDLIKPHMKNVSEVKATVIAKSLVVIYGVIAVAISFMIATIPGPLSQISFSLLSAFSGPLSGLFLYSVFCPWATSKGCLFGSFVSFVFMLWIAMGQNFSPTLNKTPWLPLAPTDMCSATNSTDDWTNTTMTYITSTFATTPAEPVVPVTEQVGLDNLYALSYQWFGATGIILTVGLGSLFSLVTGGPTEDPDPRYVLPFFDQLCCCLPKSWRSVSRCGFDYTKKPVDDEKEEIDIYNFEKEYMPVNTHEYGNSNVKTKNEASV
ncbi:hypothetical protein ScPMuIL_017594 [Solemya velum]